MPGTLPINELCKSPNKSTVNTEQVSPSKTISSSSAKHVPTPASKDFGMMPRKLWKSPLKNGNHEMTSNPQSASDGPSTSSPNSSISTRLLENKHNLSPVSSSGTPQFLKQRLSSKGPGSDQSKVFSTDGTQDQPNSLVFPQIDQDVSSVSSLGSLNVLKNKLSAKRSHDDQTKFFSTDGMHNQPNPLVSLQVDQDMSSVSSFSVSHDDQTKVFSTDGTQTPPTPIVSLKNDQNMSPASSLGSLNVLKQRLSSKRSGSNPSKVVSTDGTQDPPNPSVSLKNDQNISPVSSSGSLNLLKNRSSLKQSGSDQSKVSSTDRIQNPPNPSMSTKDDQSTPPISLSGSLNLLKQKLSPRGCHPSQVFPTGLTRNSHLHQPPVFSRTPNADQISFGNSAFASIHSSSPRMFSLLPRLQYSDENRPNIQHTINSSQNLISNNSTLTSVNHSSQPICSVSPKMPNVVQNQSVILDNTCTSQNSLSFVQKHSLSPNVANAEQYNLTTDSSSIPSSEVVPSSPQNISSPNMETASLQNQTLAPISIVTSKNHSSLLQNQFSPTASTMDQNKFVDPSKSEVDLSNVSFKSSSEFTSESIHPHESSEQKDNEKCEVKQVCNDFIEEKEKSKPTCKTTNVNKIVENNTESGFSAELKPTINKGLPEKFLNFKKLLTSRKSSSKALVKEKEGNGNSSESSLTSLENLPNSNQSDSNSQLVPSTFECKESSLSVEENETTSQPADLCDVTSHEKNTISFSRYKDILMKKKLAARGLKRDERKAVEASSSQKVESMKNTSESDSDILVSPVAKIESGIIEPEYNRSREVESNSENLNYKSEDETLSNNKTLREDHSEETLSEIDNASCISGRLNQNNVTLSDHSTMLSDISDTDDVLLATLKQKNHDRSISDKSEGCDTQDEDFTPNHTHTTNMDFSSLWEKQEVPALQIGDAPPAPIKTTDEANFPPSLCKILKSIKFIGPTCIQSVVWPAVLRHRNVIAIAPPHAGKSVGYILPIASQFHSLHYEDLPSANGPIAIILCSSWKAVQDVYELCYLFMQNAHVKIITLYADGRRFRNKMTNILNGCDVLIATPYEFLQALHDKVVDFSRCCHLIMDDGDKLVTHNKKELRDILLTFVEEAKEKRLETVPSLVLCAERWNKTFAYINKTLMTCPILCFTSFLEAAIYAEVPFFTHVCTPSEKKSTLLSILENANVVISVTKAEEALDLYNFLSCESIRTHLVTERMEHHTSSEKIKDWKSVHSTISPNCLIITDAALTLMPVSNAKCLIHYDVPKESRLQFGNRFSCIAENFLHKDEELHHSCHVLISEYCPLLASSLIDVIKRSCGYIPDILKKIANENEEHLNTTSPLCQYMKAFGCCKQKSCQQRHVIDSTVDAPKIVPKEGDIQALVTHVTDASHYFVRLLKYLLPDMENAVCLSAQYAKTGFLLKEFYASESNRKVVEDVIIGETYVIEEDMLFYRVKVLEIQTLKFDQRKIKLLFIDEGWVKLCTNVTLYALPDNLELPSPVVVEVYLCNVLTLDSCPDWNPQANHFVSKLILGKEIYGKIMLCIGEVLWLHPIALRTKLSFLNEYLNVQKINKALVENGFAKENRNHLNLLLSACEGKVSVPKVINEFRRTEDTSMEQPPINYAFLECNVEEEVYVSSVISPHQLYVQRKKFTDCLDDLIMKINDGVGKNKYLKCKNFHLGMYCIAPFHEDNKFYRALITDVTSESENVDLFYIDFGDNGVALKKDIYVIGPELLLLPFQAIECELRDVSATHGGWSEKSIDYLTDLTRDNEGDMKILTLMAYKKDSSYSSGGNHYIVDIWDGAKSLSQCLVQAGLAEQVETVLPAELPPETQTQPLEEEPPGYAESSDDRDPEDKDCEALFCCVLSKLLLEGHKYSSAKDAVTEAIQERESQAKSQAVITEEKDEHESHSHARNCSSVSESRDKKCSAPFQSKHPYILKILNRCPKLIPRRPLISWWDTPNQLYITINVKDITTYNLELNDHGFKFHTSLKNAVYSAEEQFYSNVHSETVVKLLTAQALNLTLHKQEAEKWPRFTKELRKFLHIKYNWEHLDDSESDESVCRNSTAENNRPSKDCDIAPFPSDESNESSTDHEEKYVEPWRKMATYKDPYDPLD
ncbi:putative ATP-dependent RNA helicase TDRD12 [Uloborus diversus]|uniref:putative ATP-dependent RNA helicase TDRD12 n=1 Tax=Uloborus diversus TaxID=327109 RepID=UPI002409060A|nr:putative ATP-dependent RNA helicase TDRD12 [Uloborus diversus]